MSCPTTVPRVGALIRQDAASEWRVTGDAPSKLDRTLRQPAFGLGLEMPGEFPEEVLPVRAGRLLAEKGHVPRLECLDVHGCEFIDLLPEGSSPVNLMTMKALRARVIKLSVDGFSPL